MRKRCSAACLLYALLAWSVSVTGQPGVTRLGVEKGLSNNSVRCIYQDRDGFIWFGTFDGLNRYDGYEFKVFRNKLNDSLSLPHNYIYAIHEDAQKRMWIGTGQGLSIYNSLTSSFSPAYYFAHGAKTASRIGVNVRSILSDQRDNMFIGTNGAGLLVQWAGTDTAVQVPLQGPDNLSVTYDADIVMDAQQRLWLFIKGHGLFRFDYSGRKLLPVNDQVPFAHDVVADTRGCLWIGTADGLYKYSIAANAYVAQYTTGRGALSANNISVLSLDEEGKLWIGTEGGGLNILNTVTGNISYMLPGDSHQSLSSESVSAIYHDNASRHWVGTLKGGINIIDPRLSQFRVITHDPSNSNSLGNNFVASFFEDGVHRLYIGTDGGGVSIWDRRQKTFKNFRHRETDPYSLSNDKVTGILEDHEGAVWVATFGGGVNQFNPATGRFRRYKCINPASGVENKSVWCLYEDHENTLWATTFGSGKVYRFNRATDQFEVFSPNLYDLLSFYEDHTGHLWAGNSHQLIAIDKQNGQHRFFEIGKPVRAIYEDKGANLWIGTEGGGLILFDPQQGVTKARYSDADGLCNNAVLNILEDGKGNLWLSTFDGIARFNPITTDFTNYYQSDGLSSSQFMYSAALRLQSGEMVFGSINGFTIFSPDVIAPHSVMPPLLMTGLWVNGKPVTEYEKYIDEVTNNQVRSLRIPYDDAVISAAFAALEYSSPGKIQYGYFLEGWDKGWNYTRNVRTANYTNLREGDYILHVKSTNADGVWNETGTLLRITVLPPWYRSWWAYLIYIALAGGLIYTYQRYRARQTHLEYQVQLSRLNETNERSERERSQALLGMEKAERERSEVELALARAEKAKGDAELEAERIVHEKERELNEKKTSFFTRISHEFRTPLTLVLNPIKDLLKRKEDLVDAEEDLRLIYHNARRMLGLVDQLLLFQKADSGMDRLKVSRLNMTGLITEVYESFTLVARAKKIDYQLQLEKRLLTMYGDREKVEVILYNLLSNAFKYTPDGGLIRLSAGLEAGLLGIKIQDNGQGISENARNLLFEKFYQAGTSKTGFGIGLFLVKHFVEMHGGTLGYESAEKAGTTFTVQMPVTKDRFAPTDIVEEEVATEHSLLEELREEAPVTTAPEKRQPPLAALTTSQPVMLVVDDDARIREYMLRIFRDTCMVYEAGNAADGLSMARQYQPDVIISDIVMPGMTGIELCNQVKADSALGHIPVILLTGNSSAEARLRGVEGGADDYITKPFEKDLLVARVAALLKNRSSLQQYFYNEITRQQNPLKISAEDKAFLDDCIAVVEAHLHDEQFSINVLATDLGMSYSKLNKKIKAIFGQPANAFVRFIRLQKAAELFINSNHNINETAFLVGMNDIKHFREQFTRLFGLKPSDFIDKYRKGLGRQYHLNEKIVKREHR